MKNVIFLLIGLATALPILNAQKNKISTINLDLDEVSSIGLSLDAIVTLTEGSSQKISIEGPENLIEDINTSIENWDWNIKYDSYLSNKVRDQLKIEIQLKTIHNIAVSGIGTIQTKGKFSKVKNRNIAISGTGSISFQGDSDDLRIALSGTGDMDLNCNAKNMHVALSGSGDIDIQGSTNLLNMAASGSGNMGSNKLRAKKCKAVISGSSILTAEVSNELKLQVSGSGTFRYSGNPTIDKTVSSKSSLKRI